MLNILLATYLLIVFPAFNLWLREPLINSTFRQKFVCKSLICKGVNFHKLN